MKTLTNPRGVPSAEMQSAVLKVLTAPEWERLLQFGIYHDVSYTGRMQDEAGYLQRKAFCEACIEVCCDVVVSWCHGVIHIQSGISHF
mgnify:CR=1 FL=1